MSSFQTRTSLSTSVGPVGSQLRVGWLAELCKILAGSRNLNLREVYGGVKRSERQPSPERYNVSTFLCDFAL